MVKVTLFTAAGLLRGFEMSGHAGAGGAGSDIVCAAVSSAAYMAANTVTEVIGVQAEPEVGDARMKLLLNQEEAEKAQDILKGLELHILNLQKAHPKNIKVIYGGVKYA